MVMTSVCIHGDDKYLGCIVGLLDFSSDINEENIVLCFIQINHKLTSIVSRVGSFPSNIFLINIFFDYERKTR